MTGLKNKIVNRTLTIGSWITIGKSEIAEIMAKSGFDWLTIDMEHSAINLSQAQEMIRVIELNGVTPFVRVGDNNPTIIKRVMDAGAHGVIVPMVNTKTNAEAAVAAVKYPPLGIRGVGLGRAQKYGFGFEEYKKWVEQESIVIVQIEHIRAIENLEAILNTPGVDGSIVGPYDLSGSLGRPGEFERPEVEEALKRYEAVCDKMMRSKGFHVVQPDSEKTNLYVSKGYSFIAVGLDSLYLGRKCREVMKEIIR